MNACFQQNEQVSSGPARALRQAAKLLTHDYCPGANRFVAWIRQPLTVLAVAGLVSLAIGTTVTPLGYVVFAAIAAASVLGIAWPFLSFMGLQCSLRFSRERVREGEAMEAVLVIHNRAPWPAWGVILEQGFFRNNAESPDGDVATALALVPGFARTEFRWQFVPLSRGEYPLQPPRLTSAFPFGLWRRSLPVEVQSKLLVWPRAIALEEFPLREGATFSLGAHSMRQTGWEGEVLGTRQFREGDLLRYVHWAQTARHGRLIVAERQASRTTKVLIRVNAAEVGAPLEWMLRVAVSICQSLHRHDIQLLVELNDEAILLEPGLQGWQRFNDRLARWTPKHSVPGRNAPKRRGERHLSIDILSQQVAELAPQEVDLQIVLAADDSSSIAPGPGRIVLPVVNNVLEELQIQWRMWQRGGLCHA